MRSNSYRPVTTRWGIALPFVLSVVFAFPANSADQPADELNRTFQAAKASLAAENLIEAEHQFNRTIAKAFARSPILPPPNHTSMKPNAS